MSFKTRLQETDDLLTCALNTIPSPVVVQAMASAGLDAVIIDLEHGAVDYGTAHAMITATQGTSCAPLVRIAKLDDAHVKRTLDLGAEGVMFPLIKTAEEADWAVKSLRYPPNGTRAFGPFIGHSRWGTDFGDYIRNFDGKGVCVILAETLEAAENIEDICTVPGIDMIIPAPFDLSAALGIPGQFDNPRFLELEAHMENAIRNANIPMGSIAMDKDRAQALFDRGHRCICGADVLWLKQKVSESLSWCRSQAD